eukprot:CAMPEP_0172455620 /NCGR_PEP_ID=MMETSP1065-20121228/12160_1 /TAXON_ID=265537 /ORGANISM="Amphiprora paludosa, Strain CCMP125" /LENGTH=561 /DNA_ID=CAMNT_0013208087 /DNA_START=51 /DNA_END=1736 /DNA_ORIENTATION=-
MEFVEVKRDSGQGIGLVGEGNTKTEALERLGQGPGGLFDRNNFGLLDSDRVTRARGPYVFRPQEFTPNNEALLRAERDAERAKRQKLEQDVVIARMAALQSKTTTEKVLSATEDVLNTAFNDAEVVDFWLPELNDGQVWPGPWQQYQNTDPQRTELTSIQPVVDRHFQVSFPQASAFTFADTHTGWNGLTHDATLFLRDGPNVELRIAAIFEWVGQDETGWPSKQHKAKFLRDCLRIYLRCGKNREVHGVITDLSRLVAVKVVGCTEDGVPLAKKTATLSGGGVRDVLTRFAFATSDQLSVENVKWVFPGGGGTATRPRQRSVYGGKKLGSGLHGSVFSSADGQFFIKSFAVADECMKEVSILRTLNQVGVPYMVILNDVGVDGKSFIGSPVGTHSGKYQGQTKVWRLGAQLVDCLRQMHGVGLCHRDVRPENIVVQGKEEAACLIDFACASRMNEETAFVGTTHYAPESVLAVVENVCDKVTPTPAHDLESLVYTIYDLSRPPERRPQAVSVSEPMVYLRARAIKAAWIQEAASSTPLLSLLNMARQNDYGGLKVAFECK